MGHISPLLLISFARVELLEHHNWRLPLPATVRNHCPSVSAGNGFGGVCNPDSNILCRPFGLSMAYIATFMPWTFKKVTLNDRLICQWLNLEGRFMYLLGDCRMRADGLNPNLTRNVDSMAGNRSYESNTCQRQEHAWQGYLGELSSVT